METSLVSGLGYSSFNPEQPIKTGWDFSTQVQVGRVQIPTVAAKCTVGWVGVGVSWWEQIELHFRSFHATTIENCLWWYGRVVGVLFSFPFFFFFLTEAGFGGSGGRSWGLEEVLQGKVTSTTIWVQVYVNLKNIIKLNENRRFSYTL